MDVTASFLSYQRPPKPMPATSPTSASTSQYLAALVVWLMLFLVVTAQTILGLWVHQSLRLQSPSLRRAEPKTNGSSLTSLADPVNVRLSLEKNHRYLLCLCLFKIALDLNNFKVAHYRLRCHWHMGGILKGWESHFPYLLCLLSLVQVFLFLV